MATELQKQNNSVSTVKTWLTNLDSLEISADSSHELAIKTNLPFLSTVRKESGKAEALKIIQAYVLRVSEFYGEEFTEFQITETANQIYDNYFYYKLSELKHCFNRIFSGYYEKLQYKLTPAYITNCFRLYDNDRSNHFNGKKSEPHSKEKLSPEIERMIKDFIREMRNKDLAARSKHQIESDEEFPEHEYAYKVRALVNEFFATHPRESTAKELTDYVTEKLKT